MISLPDLWVVSYTVAGIAVAASAAGLLAVRLLARRSMAALLSVGATVVIVTSLAGVVVIAVRMFISVQDRNVVMAVVTIAGLAGFVVALLVGRRVTAASRLLLAAVREVGRTGRYDPPGAVLPAEFAALSGELATAHRRLAESRSRERALEASRRELVAWVSHDLRAPLAGLRAMAEALEDGVVTDPETVGAYHTQIRREADRLSAMIDDLFELARIHAGALRLSQRLVGLDDLVSEALASTEPLAKAKGVRLRGSSVPGLPVLVDADEFGRALRNLVTNAIRHTPSDGLVEVQGDVQRGMACVSVADACGGIAPDALGRVFDVAFRGETARTPGTGNNAGLGLSIARGIVEAHAGQIAVQNVRRGCEFVIRLPLGRAAPARAATPGRRADPIRCSRPGGAAQRCPGEPGHAGPEAHLGPEAEAAGRGVGGGHDVPDVAQPEPAGHLGRRAAERVRQGAGHLAHRVRVPARDVERRQRARHPTAQPGQVRPGHVVNVDEVPQLPPVLEDLRRPAAFQRGPEDRRDTRVGRVPRHPRAVHVVIAERDRRPAGHPRPDGRQVLLGDLAGRVRAARVERRVLGHRGRREPAGAFRAARLEPAVAQVAGAPRRGTDPPVPGAVVGALPVHDHRRGEHEPPDPAAAHRLEQHRGAGDVDVGICRQVRHVDAEADQGGLVTHHVGARHGPADRPGVADVGHGQVEAVREVTRRPGMHGGSQRVHAPDLMAGGAQGIDGVGADEACRPGHHYPHASSESRPGLRRRRGSPSVTGS